MRKAMRAGKGLTQKNLAEVSSRTYVSKLERGQSSPTLGEFGQWAENTPCPLIQYARSLAEQSESRGVAIEQSPVIASSFAEAIRALTLGDIEKELRSSLQRLSGVALETCEITRLESRDGLVNFELRIKYASESVRSKEPTLSVGTTTLQSKLGKLSMYDIHEHRHRVAVWGAGRAYSRQGPGHTIAVAKHLIEKSGLGAINTADQLPPPNEMNEFIHQRIQAVIDASKGLYYTKRAKGEPDVRKALVCTYGRAQKLVNMYLKLKIVCAGYHDHPHVKAMHPPLDAVLLKALDSSDSIDRECDLPVFRRKLKTAKDMSKTWTTFDRTTYDAYISAIRTFQGNQPLWAIERLWNPEREALPA